MLGSSSASTVAELFFGSQIRGCSSTTTLIGGNVAVFAAVLIMLKVWWWSTVMGVVLANSHESRASSALPKGAPKSGEHCQLVLIAWCWDWGGACWGSCSCAACSRCVACDTANLVPQRSLRGQQLHCDTCFGMLFVKRLLLELAV